MTNPDKNAVRYFSVSVDGTGAPQVSVETSSLEYTDELPAGYAEVEGIQAGACTSELYYFGRRRQDAPSRFESDLADHEKQEYYLERNRLAGINSAPESIARFKKVMNRSMFHEGFCRVTRAELAHRSALPLLMYVPLMVDGRLQFVRRIEERTLEESLEPGRLAVRNPSYLCDRHSSATLINPDTGWPYQCDRSLADGHEAKGTIGHTEFVGAAVAGLVRVPLSSLTPLPDQLQAFVEQDLKHRGVLLTLTEPLGCVFDAFGTMLERKETPRSVLIIGDGTSALNIVLFLQIHAPDAQVVVVGMHLEKLEGIRSLNPDHVAVLKTDGENLEDLPGLLRSHTGATQVDVVLPTVGVEKKRIDPYVETGGTLIWWAAEVSELAPALSVEGRYRERFPYGGAPHAEFSALALLEHLVLNRADVVKSYLEYPGFYAVSMDEKGAKDIDQWLTHEGRLEKTVMTSRGEEVISVKPIIELGDIT